MGRFWWFIFVFSCLLTVHVNLYAQSSQLLEELQQRQDEQFRRLQEREELRRRANTKDVRLNTPAITSTAIPDDESPCFVINQIRLIGLDTTQTSANNFQWALDKVLTPKATADNAEKKVSLLGRCYGVQGINIIMRRIQNTIIERGYITTRVVAGPQELETGILTLTIVPGRIASIHFKQGHHPAKTTLPFREGDLLNLRDIEQALENLKRLPSVDTDIKIIPAKGAQAKPGESDLLVIWKQKRPWRFSLSADNSGAESTGVYQGTVSVAYDNLFGLSDTFTADYGEDLGDANPGEGGTESVVLAYSFPVSYWQVGLSSSQYEYFQTIEGAFSDIIYRGESQSEAIDLSRLVYRNSTRKVNLGLNVWSRSSNNYIDDVEVLTQRRRTSGYYARIDYREFLGKSTVNGSFTYHKGASFNNALPAPEEASGNGTAEPVILKTSAQLSIPFHIGKQALRYAGQWRHQQNRDPLVAQDYFTIGNRYTVRAGDGNNSISAESGWFIRNDLELATFNGNQFVYFGYDYGHVSGTSNRPDWTILSGATFGLKGRHHRWTYDFSTSWTLKEPDGYDTDAYGILFSINWQY